MTTLTYRDFSRRDDDAAAFSMLIISMTLVAIASFALIAFNVDPLSIDDTNTSGVIDLSVTGDASPVNAHQ